MARSLASGGSAGTREDDGHDDDNATMMMMMMMVRLQGRASGDFSPVRVCVVAVVAAFLRGDGHGGSGWNAVTGPGNAMA